MSVPSLLIRQCHFPKLELLTCASMPDCVAAGRTHTHLCLYLITGSMMRALFFYFDIIFTQGCNPRRRWMSAERDLFILHRTEAAPLALPLSEMSEFSTVPFSRAQMTSWCGSPSHHNPRKTPFFFQPIEEPCCTVADEGQTWLIVP